MEITLDHKWWFKQLDWKRKIAVMLYCILLFPLSIPFGIYEFYQQRLDDLCLIKWEEED